MGEEELGHHEGVVLEEVLVGEGGPGVGRDLPTSKGGGGGGEEVGFADAEDGTEGEGKGDVVDEAGATDLDGGNGEGAEEGSEGAAGDAEGCEGLDEEVLGVEPRIGPDRDVGEGCGGCG